MSADVLPFPGNPGAPITPIVPRSSFGLRQARHDALVSSFDETVRPADRVEIDRVKAAARAARALYEGKPTVCPSLKADLAARIRGVAQQLETLSAEAQSYGLTSTRVALMEHAGLLESEAALVEAG